MEGIEPSSGVLETLILPMNYTPKTYTNIIYHFQFFVNNNLLFTLNFDIIICMKKVTIYTDGSCLSNPGPGGWACILMHNEKYKEISGAEANTTNNRMEMRAIIEAIKALKVPCEVELYSDSAYVINAFNQNWIESWEKNNWKNSQRKPVLNYDLWIELLEVLKYHKVNFNKVKGHSDNIYNNRCDELARSKASQL